MSKQFAKLKIYEIGGGVAFQTETGTVPFEVIPKGEATMKPWGASGFVFEKVVTGDVIAFVDTFDDLLDSAGVAWGISQAAVFTAVGAFFFELGGGGDAIDVNYDNSVSGLAATNVQDAIDELAADLQPAYTYVTETSANYQTFLETKANIITKTYDANTLLAYPVIIRERVTISQILAFFTAGAVGNLVYGIYDQAANGLPGDLIVQTTAFNTAIAPALQTYNLPANLTLERGVYWIAYNSSSAPTGVAVTTLGVLANLYESGFGNFQSYYFKALAYTGTLPASFGAGTFSTTQSINIAEFRTV